MREKEISYPREYIISIRDMEGNAIKKLSHLRLIMPDYYDKGWYVQSISFSAFFNSYKPHNVRNKDRHLWYTQMRREDFEGNEKHHYEFLKEKDYLKDIDYKLTDIERLPLVRGIWDFYDHINFDYKKKRYKHDIDGSQMRETRRKERIAYKRIQKLYEDRKA